MPSFGENLRRERELRGVSLRDIAEATKISVRFLQAIEQDRVDVLPGGLFPRAFVRQYARCLGLDADRLVAEFLYAHGDGVTESVAPPPSHEEGRRVGVILLVVALGIGLLWLPKSGPTRPRAAEAPAATPPVSTPPVERVYPAPAQAVSASESASENLVLNLSARQSCWVQVQVDGRTVLNRVLNEGETETLEAQGEIVLSVGNAGGLSFTINDRRGVPLGRSGEVRRNIVITRQSLPSLVEDAPAAGASHSG